MALHPKTKRKEKPKNMAVVRDAVYEFISKSFAIRDFVLRMLLLSGEKLRLYLYFRTP